MKRIKLLAVLALSIALFTANAGRAFAANSTSITLSGASAQVGNNLTVFITENSGSTTINLVTTNLSYDSSKLQFVEFNDSGSEFDYKGAQSASGGSASVKRGLQGGAYTGSHRVVGITFKALAAGSASVSVTSATVTNPQAPTDVEWNGQKDSATATISAAPVAVAPAPTTPTATTPKASTSTTKTATTTGSTTAATDESKAQVEGDSTTAATDTKKKDTKSDNKDSKKDDAKKTSSKSGFWFSLLAILAIAAGFILGRRAVAAKAAARARAAEKAAAAAAAAKAAEKKTAKASNKKNTKKAKK